jgi:hypothetical protein
LQPLTQEEMIEKIMDRGYTREQAEQVYLREHQPHYQNTLPTRTASYAPAFNDQTQHHHNKPNAVNAVFHNNNNYYLNNNNNAHHPTAFQYHTNSTNNYNNNINNNLPNSNMQLRDFESDERLFYAQLQQQQQQAPQQLQNSFNNPNNEPFKVFIIFYFIVLYLFIYKKM